MSKTVITFGTFDVFHVGHLKILKRAAAYGDKLIVGISTDRLNLKKKNKMPICDQSQRMLIVDAIKYVDKCFFEESLEKKREYILKYKADVLVMGDDWKGKFDNLNDICEVAYLPRTPSISTTEIVEHILVSRKI
ncbi:adenylyltransferase/cytidyltransferase family protein [Porticoccaceae bacterium]|nr:adenylyltransferase/cytidyltransferase family protein [Porticoccaceae bacterium]MDA8898571.1 adenylyltransferase/cytidyltransferase family protein [Porticoccaceae bacterium]